MQGGVKMKNVRQQVRNKKYTFGSAIWNKVGQDAFVCVCVLICQIARFVVRVQQQQHTHKHTHKSTYGGACPLVCVNVYKRRLTTVKAKGLKGLPTRKPERKCRFVRPFNITQIRFHCAIGISVSRKWMWTSLYINNNLHQLRNFFQPPMSFIFYVFHISIIIIYFIQIRKSTSMHSHVHDTQIHCAYIYYYYCSRDEWEIIVIIIIQQ